MTFVTVGVIAIILLAILAGAYFSAQRAKSPVVASGHDAPHAATSESLLAICTGLLVIATVILALVTWGLKISTDNIYTEEKTHATEEWMRDIHQVEERVDNANRAFPTTRECERYILSLETNVGKLAAEAQDDKAKASSVFEAIVEDDRLPPSNWLKPSDALDACLMGLYQTNPTTEMKSVSDLSKFLFIREEIDDYFNVMQNWDDALRALPDDENFNKTDPDHAALFETHKTKFLSNITDEDARYLATVVDYIHRRQEARGKHMKTMDVAESYSNLCQTMTIRGIELRYLDCTRGQIFH